MAEQNQDDQLEYTYSSNVRIWDVALETNRRRWTIGRSGERGSGISVLAARHDDDDLISSQDHFQESSRGSYKWVSPGGYSFNEIATVEYSFKNFSCSFLCLFFFCLIFSLISGVRFQYPHVFLIFLLCKRSNSFQIWRFYCFRCFPFANYSLINGAHFQS